MQNKNKKFKYIIRILEIGLLGIIIYLSNRFYCQMQDTKNIKVMHNQLINAILPLSNLLSRSAGNLDEHELEYKIDVKPALSYDYQNKIHKLELILLNPTYSLIDCTGDLAKETVYPLKINFIWQPMLKFADQYELICEKHNNSSNIQRKVLLQHINDVKFKFIESSEVIKDIHPRKLYHGHNQQIAAVQIGMLVQTHSQAHAKKQYKNYHLFNKKINYLDKFLHRVIYITLPSSVV